MTQQIELPVATLNDVGLATSAGWLTVYSIDPVLREYQQSVQEYLPEGVGLPAYCFVEPAPSPSSGFAIVRSADGAKWEMVQDHRGDIVYSTTTGQPGTVHTLGSLTSEVTRLAPMTEHDKWNGTEWITDTVAERDAYMAVAQAELTKLQRMATDKIGMLQDAADLDMATDQELAALKSWKTYRVLLGRVDLSTAPNIKWPAVPE